MAGSKAAATIFDELTAKNQSLLSKHFVITNNLVAYKPVQVNSKLEWQKVSNVADAKLHSDSAVLISSSLKKLWDDPLDVSGNSLKDNQKEQLQQFRDASDLRGFTSYCRDEGILQDVLIQKKEPKN